MPPAPGHRATDRWLPREVMLPAGDRSGVAIDYVHSGFFSGGSGTVDADIGGVGLVVAGPIPGVGQSAGSGIADLAVAKLTVRIRRVAEAVVGVVGIPGLGEFTGQPSIQALTLRLLARGCAPVVDRPRPLRGRVPLVQWIDRSSPV